MDSPLPLRERYRQELVVRCLVARTKPQETAMRLRNLVFLLGFAPRDSAVVAERYLGNRLPRMWETSEAVCQLPLPHSAQFRAL
jgi:hypothetical protein